MPWEDDRDRRSSSLLLFGRDQTLHTHNPLIIALAAAVSKKCNGTRYNSVYKRSGVISHTTLPDHHPRSYETALNISGIALFSVPSACLITGKVTILNQQHAVRRHDPSGGETGCATHSDLFVITGGESGRLKEMDRMRVKIMTLSCSIEKR